MSEYIRNFLIKIRKIYTKFLYNMLFVYRKAFQTDMKIKKFF